VNITLTENEARVLGALLEKEITTPEYYPLSVNALMNACNQKSNRDPVMNFDEDAVRGAVRSLQDQFLARSVSGADSRVTKYEHRLQEAFNFDRREAAIICELLVRNDQTPGELRSRAERMHHFDDLGEVQSTLQRLASRQPPLVKILPRQPGTKESRYMHLLSGEPAATESSSGVDSHHDARRAEAPDHTAVPTHQEELARLTAEVAELRQEIAELKQQFASFRKQFD
jgi:uncharacterized protein